MRITDIRIDRFGVWEQIDLPLRGSALHVCYGPNASGKTTLLHFLRGVLYGFETLAEQEIDHLSTAVTSREASIADDRGGLGIGGSLRIEHEGREFEVHRGRNAEGQETLRIEELLAGPSSWSDRTRQTESSRDAQRVLTRILDGATADVFRRVFAIGLSELRAFRELTRGDIAEHVYGLTLGAQGRALSKLFERTLASREQYFEQGASDLRPLLNRERELSEQLAALGDQRLRYHELCTKRDELQEQIERLQARRRDLQSDLRGHTTIVRSHEPWQRVRELERELAELPAVSQPKPAKKRDDSQVKALRRDYQQAQQEYRSARQSARELSRELARTRRATVQTAADPYVHVRGLLGQRAWLEETQQRIEQAETAAVEAKREFEARQQALGPDWPIHRIQQVDTGFTAYYRLSDMGRVFDMATTERDKLQKRYQKVAEAMHQRRSEYDAAIKTLPEGSLKAAIAAARLQIREGEEFARRRFTQRELEQRIINLKRELNRLESRPDLPRWAPGFLLFLGLGGAILSGLGFLTGLTSNGIAGLILATIGLAGFFIAQAFRLHSEGHIRDDLAELRMRIRTHQAELGEMRRQNEIHGLIEDDRSTKESVAEAEARLISAGNKRLTELKRLASAYRQIRKSRKRLVPLKRRFQEAQRTFDATRQQWCDLVRQHNLPESLHVDETLFIWQTVAEVAEHHQVWQTAEEELQTVRRQWKEWQRRIEEAGRQAGLKADYAHPVTVLKRWATEVKEVPSQTQTATEIQEDPALRERYQSARRRVSDRKRNLQRIRREYNRARRAFAAVVEETPSTTDEQLRLKRLRVEARLEEARAQLKLASQDTGDLAIVESDLENYTRSGHDSQSALSRELQDIERQMATLSEQLRGVNEEIRELENDRRAVRLRAERAAVRSQLKQRLTEWAATETAGEAMQRIRSDYERDGQPGTLANASEYLAQLTEGQYRRVWTPFGQQRLMVESKTGSSLSMEQLSNGTREQLYLAMRMAVVKQFANDGVELPMVLDDVLVNFDERRADAAMATLADFAEHGQQVLLLTCHAHQARLAERHGTEPIWLPQYAAGMESRRVG